MTTKRKTIRKAVAAVLNGNTSAGANVFASRVRPVSSASLPAILVYANDEEVEVFNASPREYKRTLTLGIEIAARADDGLDDALDDIAQQVERIISENQTAGGASDYYLSGVHIELTGEGNSQHGSCILTYDVEYYTYDVSLGVAGPGVPDENILEDFKRGGTTWRPNGATEDSPQAQDLFPLEQAG